MSALQVWRRLEVGPATLEPNRLRVPYTITDEQGTHTQMLTFRWVSPVFEPTDPSDQQLAALIGAQVALNYGLFCHELVLHGPFDQHDQRFLVDMLHNTAREIYVNKLLLPNPFLVPGALALEPVPRPEDLCGAVLFPDGIEGSAAHPWGDGTAILSSGGKDSLLTQGVCEELGYAPHALFANESGRHWFTALNAWRHLERTRPDRTARVWTDCDRMYTFMLRHLPFIRPDFADVRADVYPIRLWTVAVFLFGVLPMVRARGIGRILVGDEWDTTWPATTADGVDHYKGYYDQSRFFDERLTALFARKGWQLAVLSLLRPLSELTIEDVLSARYPELFALQVSCHAARVEGERVLPCRQCEKCRRIVGMLVALGRDPSVLGYDEPAVAKCLHALASKGANQLEDGQHLAAVLADAGHIPADSAFARQGQHHPETTRLRFDPVRSPPDVVPVDLRVPTWRIFLDHADGAVQLVHDSWVEVDPLALGFAETHHPSGVPEEHIPPGHNTHLLGELTWPQARRRLREVDVALLPVGAIEQHGPHLPLDTDTWDAAYQCAQVAAACSDPKPLVLPGLPYGVSYHHDDFPGTLSVGPDTLARMVHEIGVAAARNGIKKLIIVNGHGGNGPALQFAAQLINRDAHIFTTVDTGETSDAELQNILETGGDAHAGEYETSTSLATRPHLVYLEHARVEQPNFPSRYLDFDSSVSVEWYVRTARISQTGTLGDPTRASAEKGHRIWEITIRNLVELVEYLKRTPLEDLHRGARGHDI